MSDKNTTPCPACNGTGSCDSGGETPWGAPIEVRCECACPELPAPTAQQPACDEYAKLYGFFLEAVGLASMAADDFHKPYIEDMLRRARAQLKDMPTPGAAL